MRALPVLLVLLLPLSSGCRRTHTVTMPVPATPNTLVAGMVIDSAGSWSHTAGTVTTEVSTSVAGNSVNVTVSRTERRGHSRSGSSSANSIHLNDPADPWFVFVETPERLWYFDGRGALTYAITDSGGGRSGPAIFGDRLHADSPPVPDALAARLPEKLRKLVPPAVPPQEMPSF